MPPSIKSGAKVLQTDRRPVQYYDGLLGILEDLLSIITMYIVAEEVVLIMVSNASVERVFSVLNHSVDDHQ
jgi:hypothetical protein